MTRTTILTTIILWTFLSTATWSAEFENWTLNGTGKQPSPDVLEISGIGEESGRWSTKTQPVQPGGLYRYGISVRGVDTQGGCLPCGLTGMNRDYPARQNEWTNHSFCFRFQDTTESAAFHLGQWNSKGVFQFRDLKFEPVVPVLKENEHMILGDGESVLAGIYRFNGRFHGSGSNFHRPLFYSNAPFNSNRWCLNENSKVVYRFRLENTTPKTDSPLNFGPKPIPFDGGTVTIGVCYHASGKGIVEISRDGKERWTELGRLDKVGTKEFALPTIAFPLDEFYLRIRGTKGCNFQVDLIGVEAPLAETAPDAPWKNVNFVGETLFASYTGETPKKTDQLTITDKGKLCVQRHTENASFEHEFPLRTSPEPGEIEQKFKVGPREYTLNTKTHPLHRSDYGYSIAPNLWWCEADWKVSKIRSTPSPETKKAIGISAAKNDVEGFQLVIRAPDDKPIKGLTVDVDGLKTSDGKTISLENVEVLYAYYHFAHSKTDDTGLIDYWPDALPPLDKPIDVEPGKNQPIWINVKIPADAAPGTYVGMVGVNVENSRIHSIPFTVQVWDFALPKENRHETAFGFNPWRAADYHNAKTDADRRRVVDMYLQCFADHRISIYNPTPFDGMGVKWMPNDEEPEKSYCEIDFSRYEKEMDRVLEKYHFSNFTVPGHGLGSGTFHDRTPPAIGKYGDDTPQYEAMMTDYYKKLVDFLKRKGWLEKAYVYWFDEPAEKDYEFVAAGTAKLQKYAPDLARMMTVMLSDDKLMPVLNKFETSFDIWCPVSHHFQEDLAKTRTDKGERFWWYVCTGPKAPYCTLFIDHPATELRVWHWQAWQRNIVGSLIWETVWWTSRAAFPNGFQNPYEDPMGYMDGYATPPGTKHNWGNGDGRFIYPPLSAAVPELNNGKPNFDKPVSCIRWEMLREGVEDVEMLYLLRDLLAEKGSKLSETERSKVENLLIVPESVTKSITEFTIDPRPLLERRREIGEAIEQLQRIK